MKDKFSVAEQARAVSDEDVRRTLKEAREIATAEFGAGGGRTDIVVEVAKLLLWRRGY